MSAPSSILPFNEIEINGVTVGDDVFVAGSGEYRINGVQTRVVTADGTIHKGWVSKTFEFSCEMLGDQTALNTDAPDQDQIIILSQELYGVVDVEYNPETGVSAVSGSGKVIVAPEPILSAAAVDGTTGGALVA